MGRLFDALTIDHVQLARDRERVTRGVLGAGTGAIRDTTKDLERKLEALTKASVPGKLWRAWKSNSFPRTGIAKEPVGTVFLNGKARTQGAVEFFTRPGRIRAKSGRFLAVPLPAAGARGRLRNLSPAEWTRRTGVELRLVERRGKSPLLVAKGRISGGRFVAIKRAPSLKAQRRGYVTSEATVPIFVLVPQVAFANRFAIEPTVQAAQGDLVREAISRIRGLALDR